MHLLRGRTLPGPYLGPGPPLPAADDDDWEWDEHGRLHRVARAPPPPPRGPAGRPVVMEPNVPLLLARVRALAAGGALRVLDLRKPFAARDPAGTGRVPARAFAACLRALEGGGLAGTAPPEYRTRCGFTPAGGAVGGPAAAVVGAAARSLDAATREALTSVVMQYEGETMGRLPSVAEVEFIIHSHFCLHSYLNHNTAAARRRGIIHSQFRVFFLWF